MNIAIRLALAILFLDELVVGASNALVPAAFYRHFPTVDLTPPFSEHYARDFGGATLGIALLLGIALVRPSAHFAIPAALAYSVFAVPHFFYHLMHLHGATPAEAVGLTTANAIVALLGLGIVIAVILRDRRAATGAGESSAAPGSALS
ncbi:hypothetical protein [Brachybacterium subflavum]|uniref:hypothetical protein n=1 Tax=Brachybacterium subflavum TaxID=2585206 RepID=UPI00126687CD|nr:hypothetical protein [Brachybacterium subflavum]